MPCQSAGRPLSQWSKGREGGKSGLHRQTVPDNLRRGRPQRQCHREQTASSSDAARVKRCGKSAPRLRQRRRHGKPHREQDRIGTAPRDFGNEVTAGRSGPSRSGRLLEMARKCRSRGMAVTCRVVKHAAPYRTRLTGRLMFFVTKGPARTRRALHQFWADYRFQNSSLRGAKATKQSRAQCCGLWIASLRLQ
jgi:hypothetical protein